MSEIKTIGVLTSGGDAPGMNAAIRAVTRCAVHYGKKVMAINKGYFGLINGDIKELTLRLVSDILHRGGTVLQTARCPEFKTGEGVDKGIEMLRKFDINGLVVIGGDGSFRGARDLSLKGIPTVGIPATIDNDIDCTEYTIGYDTALNTAKDAIDKLRDTGESHERCNVVEVMGRDAGFIAVDIGVSNGAEVVIIPENDFDFKSEVIEPILAGRSRGKKHSIVILAEGVGGAYAMANKIEEITGIETRATILGHIQRGGSPTAKDRIMASRMGYKAVQLLNDGIGNRVVASKGNEIINYDILEGLEMNKEIDSELVELVKILAL